MKDDSQQPDGTHHSTVRNKGPETFAFARLAVPNASESKAYYEQNVGLETVGSDDGRVYLRAGTAHHCIELEEDPSLDAAKVLALGYWVGESETLEAIRQRAEKEGMDILATDATLQALTSESFAVDDPNGMRFEFFTGFPEFAEPPFSLHCPIDILHPLTATDKYEQSVFVYTKVFGFLVSDYLMDDFVFLRGEDRYHHSLGTGRGSKFVVEHIAFLAPNFDVLMRMRARAQYDGVPIVQDLVRHSGSGSVSFYQHMPQHGPRIELANHHQRFDEVEHETWRPRRLAGGARDMFDMWRAADDQFFPGELADFS
jgi:2,3-dihydroxy-p-cumate/2,3-dihydroxybenzoate 3,4-dioxygenase